MSLNWEQAFIKYQVEVKLLKDELEDVKLKLNYYLERTKITLSEAVESLGNKPVTKGSYRDVYVNLYSFSNKLKNVITDNRWMTYQNIAKMLINKEDYTIHELSEAITSILQMRDDIEYYLT